MNGQPRSWTRRELIAQAGLGLAGVALGGRAFAAGPEDEKPKPSVLVGSGEQTYECTHDWLMPPSNILWGDTHGIAQDGKGRIYIAHTVHKDSPSGDAIVVFDKSGKFLNSWGAQFRGGAHGLDLRKEGREEFLYHCDTKNRKVVKTTLDGKVIWEKGAPAEAGIYKEGVPFIPTNVAFAPNGDFYVGDGYGSSWIHRYNVKGEYVRTFGGAGSDPGKVKQPHGLWVDDRSPFSKEPLLVVADRANNRMQYFSLDGKHVGFVTEGMRRPCHFHTRDGMILIPDLSSVITILDNKNKGVPREQFVPGKFIHPHGAKFLRDGSILVAEWVPIGRVTRLKKVKR
jgi:hypothetical protein